MTRTCGECTMCCKVFNIDRPAEGLVKPANTWCQHCTPGKGCGIYEQRPPVCVDFQCLWLAWEELPDDLRPDRVKAVFQGTGGPDSRISLTIDNLDALHSPSLQSVIKAVARTQQFLIVVFKNQFHSVYFVHEGFGKHVVTQASPTQYANLHARGKLPGLPRLRFVAGQGVP